VLGWLDDVRYILGTIPLPRITPANSHLDAAEAIVSIGHVGVLKAKPQATDGNKDYGPAN